MSLIKEFYHRWFHNKKPSDLKVRNSGEGSLYVRLSSILHSEYQWRKTRNAFIKEHPNCSICMNNKDIEVHHIRPWNLFPHLRYEFSNLISLCQPCHFRFGHGRNWKKWNPEINEFAIASKDFLDDIRDEADDI